MPEAIQQLLNFIDAHTGIAIIFALIGFFASNLFGSWAKLTKRYAAQHHFTGKTWNWQTMSIGNAAYPNCITVGSNSQGLYLSPFIIFRLGYSAILILWEQLSLRIEDRFFDRLNFLEVADCPEIKIMIDDRLLHRISQASEGNFSIDAVQAISEQSKTSSQSIAQTTGQSKFKISPKLCFKIFALTFSLGLALGLFNHGLAQYQTWQFPERYSIHLPGEYTSPHHGDDWPDSFEEFLNPYQLETRSFSTSSSI